VQALSLGRIRGRLSLVVIVGRALICCQVWRRGAFRGAAALAVAGAVVLGVGSTHSVSLASGGSSYSSVVMADSPVAYWRFGESSGTTAADATGNGNTATYNAGVKLGAPGAIGGDSDTSANFDGIGGYARSDVTINTSPVTVEAWIYLTSYPRSAATVIGFSDGPGSTTRDKILYVTPEGKLEFYCWDGSTRLTSAPSNALSLYQWHHVAGVYDGTHLLAYVDGKQVGSVSASSTFTGYSAHDVFVGGGVESVDGSATVDSLEAGIDDVAIYTHALSAAEVAAHYQAGDPVARPRPATYPATVESDYPRAYWRLGESSGTAAADSTGNGQAATYFGPTLGQSGAFAGDANTAASFDGTDDYVRSDETFNDTLVTVEAWIYLTSYPSAGSTVIGFTQGLGSTTRDKVLYVTPSGKLEWYAYDTISGHTTSTPSTTLSLGQWHQVVGVFDGSHLIAYADGQEVGRTSATATYTSYGGDNLYVGGGVLSVDGSNTISYWNGKIDDVAIYNYPLTADQILTHYVAGRPPFAGHLTVAGAGNTAAPGVCTCKKGDPVDTSTGDFYQSATDAAASTFGPALQFVRSYDARQAQAEQATSSPGPLGYGWTDSWNATLSVNTPNTGDVTVNEPNGATVTYQSPSGGACTPPDIGPGTAGTYCAPAYVTATLTYDSGSSTYTFITHPYHRYTFNSTGQLTGEAIAGGATETINHGSPSPGSGLCPGTAHSCDIITSASGRAFVIVSNSSGLITSVIDPRGHSWTYTYCTPPSSTCSAGDLVSVTDPLSNVTSFTYDEANSHPSLTHDLLTITNPNGQPGGPDAGDKLVNVYNSSGQVTSQTDAAGNQTTFDYSNLNATTGNGYTLVTDPDGNETKDVYNDGLIVSHTVGYGTGSPSTWDYEPDGATLLTTRTIDPNDAQTSTTYDAAGNPTSATNPLGNTTTASYNSFDEPVCTTTPLAAAGCASLSPPSPITAGTATVSPPSSAPPKHVTYREYDTDGNLIWTTEGDYAPGGSSASQSRTTYELYSGQSVTLGTNTDSCAASPPASSLPCLTIDPNGVVTQLGYDATTGDLTSSSTLDGNAGGELATTTFTYDGNGSVATQTEPDGNVSGGNAADFTTTYTYDNDQELTGKTVSHTGGGITARTTSYGYDGDGNQTSVTNPRGKVTTTTFDANDRPVLVTDPDSQQTLACYDGDGNLAETVPPVGVAANSLTAASCPTSYPSGYGTRLASDATSYTHDALGDKTTITTPAPAGQTGHETTTNTFDATGRLLSTTAPPASNSGGAPNQITVYTYDAAGELLTKTTASGTAAASTTSYCYDPDSNRTASVAPDGNTTTVATCSSSSPYQTSSNYQTGYSFDSLGEPVSVVRPATTWATSGQETDYTYDPAGNLLTSTDPNAVTTTNTYTPLNQIATTSYSGSAAHSVNYSYDANGNRVTMADATGTSSYGYDTFNELTSYENGDSKTVTYTYNADGQVATIGYQLGSPSWATSNTVTYSYDNADELNAVTDFNGNTVTVGNTADGLPNSQALAATGDTLTTTYDPTDNPSQIKLATTSSTLLQYDYDNVPSGSINQETDTPTWTGSPAGYSYDAQNRVTQMTPGGGSALNYSFDASGNLTTLPTGASTTYDHASELTASTLSSTTTNYTYDADGQRTQATQGATTIAAASYNGAHELTSHNNSAADMTAATYDGDNLRITATTTPTGGSSSTQHFVWDISGSVPNVLMDSTNAYIYGGSNTPLEQVNLNTGTTTYLIADRLGSVRAIINGTTGAVTATSAYDAWGNPETTGGLTANTPIGYAGAYTDPTGLNYLINRYYDPITGQFVTVDPALDQTEAPYNYANGDPINTEDPSGLYPGQGAVNTVTNAVVGSAECIGDIQHCLSPHGAANATVSLLNAVYSFATGGKAGPGIPTPYPCNPYLSESNALGQGIFLGAGFALPGAGEADIEAEVAVATGDDAALAPVVLRATSKATARQALSGLDVTPEQLAAANRAIGRATSSSTISLVARGSDLIVGVARPGLDGYQLFVTVVDQGGTTTVTQLAFDSAGRLAHYDPKKP
jgi:RHS repeat-associated protein